LLPELCPGSHWGSLQRSSDPLVAFKLFRGGEGKGKGKEKRQGGEGRNGRGRTPKSALDLPVRGNLLHRC